MLNRVLRFLLDEDGPTAVEYAIMLFLILQMKIVEVSGRWQETIDNLQ